MSKRYSQAIQAVEKGKRYSLKDAVEAVQKSATAKFDETIEVSVKVGIDGKKTDQVVRGTVSLPHGTGRKVRVLVFARGEKEKEAQDAGADHVGSDEYLTKIQGGWLDFDIAIAVPDMMKELGKIAKILGPRGLMPNPKAGTVTFDLAKTVKEVKAGKIEFKSDAGGNVQAGIGKRSFTSAHLVDNARIFLETVIKAKPSSAKGEYLQGVTLSSTMGPGVAVDVKEFLKVKEDA